jgi:OOP family OmpA-OmpF porin
MSFSNKIILSIVLALSTFGLASAGSSSGSHVCFPYVTSSNGNVVHDSSGHCVRHSLWTPDAAMSACNGKKPKASKPKMVNKSIVLNAGALFDHDSSDIKSESTSELDDITSYINNMSDVQAVEITGHTDSRGSNQYNNALSMHRATSVKNYLIDRGVSTNVISTSGVGESQPIADNETSAGRAKNRRVEINVNGEN